MKTRPEETEAFCADLLRRIDLENRAKAAEAEISRLTALLEDRQALAKVILQHQFPDTKWSEWGKDTQEANMRLADRIRVYLRGVKSNSFT